MRLVWTYIFIAHTATGSKPDYCLPSDTACWPKPSEISDFASTLTGALLTPTDVNDTEYLLYVNMTQNPLHRNQFPSFIVAITNVEDIQSAISFASSHRLQVSMMSTGHSWSGRSTANFSLQINLSGMKHYAVDTDAWSMTVETGLPWGEIYKIADAHGHRMVVGGADPSVGPGGLNIQYKYDIY